MNIDIEPEGFIELGNLDKGIEIHQSEDDHSQDQEVETDSIEDQLDNLDTNVDRIMNLEELAEDIEANNEEAAQLQELHFGEDTASDSKSGGDEINDEDTSEEVDLLDDIIAEAQGLESPVLDIDIDELEMNEEVDSLDEVIAESESEEIDIDDMDFDDDIVISEGSEADFDADDIDF